MRSEQILVGLEIRWAVSQYVATVPYLSMSGYGGTRDKAYIDLLIKIIKAGYTQLAELRKHNGENDEPLEVQWSFSFDKVGRKTTIRATLADGRGAETVLRCSTEGEE